MKKYFLILIICLPIVSFCQFTFYTAQYMVSPLTSNCNVNLTIDRNTKWLSFYNESSDDALTNNVFISGANKIILQTRIHKDSVQFYRYSIIKGDSEYLIKDAIPNQISFRFPPKSDFPGYYLMDLYNSKAEDLKVKIYRTSDETKISTIVIYNQLKPITILSTGIATATSLSKGYSNPFKTLGNQAPPQSFLKLMPIEDGSALEITDSTKTLSIKIKNNGISSIYQLVLTHYDDELPEEKVFESNNWKGGYLTINAEYFRKPGKYQIAIFPSLKIIYPQKNPLKIKAKTFSFVVKKSKKNYSTQELVAYCIIIGLTIAILAFIYLYLIRKRDIKLLIEQEREKMTAKLQLSSVRSQLNPHFLFNALSGIQNLMNKNEIENANKYLAKFARLTRNVLDDNELISLAQEKTLLDDYLQMEQLRFGFSYEIKTDDNLDLENIEIPSMLLQPFVENAVKHGIASKTTEGNIEITFSKNGNNLVLTVADNGKGFDTDKKHEGLGLSLSKNRISLLNSIYKETPFVLAINSNNAGTKINLTLTDWL